MLAAKQGQPWRVELGDQDADVNDQHYADVNDQHWPQAAAGARSRTAAGH